MYNPVKDNITLTGVENEPKKEIQAEALTQDLGAYSRFLDLAAELSGQYINYSKVSSDTEINKVTIRRYFDILQDTLLVERIDSYTSVNQNRRARQKNKFIFFDLGVRNYLAGLHGAKVSSEEHGKLFEQWIILQVIYYNRIHHYKWNISTYKDANNVEIDLLIETSDRLIAIEIKSSNKANERMFKSLQRFRKLVEQNTTNILVYQGEIKQQFEQGLALPYQDFLDELAFYIHGEANP